MCGIVGVMGDLTPKVRRAFREMLYVGTLRGFDSTGILTATPHSRDWIKKAISAPDFLGMANVQKMVDGYSKLLLGHNRAATKGKVVSVNAHPFQFDNITGVHNGTLTHRYKLDNYAGFEVDSENLFYHLQLHGLQDTIDNCEGAYTLVWHDSEDGTLNVFRNEQRPFHYCYSEDRKSMYWASEASMLEWILRRNNIIHKDILELPAHTHLTVPVPKTNAKLQPHLKKVTPAAKPIFIRQAYPVVKKDNSSSVNSSTKSSVKTGTDSVAELYGRGEDIEFTLDIVQYNGYNQKVFAGLTTDGNKAKVRVYAQQCEFLRPHIGTDAIFTATISKDPHEIITVSPHTVMIVVKKDRYYGYEGEEFDYETYRKKCDKGCSWCSSPASVDDAEVLWYAKDEHLCSSCQQEEDVKQYLSSAN